MALVVGYCEYHEEYIDIEKFEWKGCWTCNHFRKTNKELLYTSEAAKIANVSPSTIRRWIKEGKIKGIKLEMGRSEFVYGPRRIWLVIRESLENYLQRRAYLKS